MEHTQFSMSESLRVIGREKEKDAIVKFLCENGRGLKVITLFGTAGVGKSTLARLVCDDESIERQFGPVMWANACNNFNLKLVIEDLLGLDNDHRGLLSMDELQKQLRRELKGSRSLIVLDDVGNLTFEQCNELRDLLVVGMAGVLITTLDQGMAELLCESFSHRNSCDEKRNEVEEFKKSSPSDSKTSVEEIEREGGKRQIIEFLLNGSDKKLSSLSVLVNEGLENTTLVKSVYNDKSVKDHFELLKWAKVSHEKFNLSRVTECLLGEENTDKTLELLRTELVEELKLKRFLLVLDDIVDMNRFQWDKLRDLLLNENVGNKVLITTHDQRIALLTDTSILLAPLCVDKVLSTTLDESIACMKMHLEPLSADECWDLFIEGAVFRSNEQERHPELVQIGKEIMERCERVPLAVRTLAGILLNETEEWKWLEVRNRMSSGPLDVRSCLKLSFDTLPSPIKSCFAYTAISFTSHPPDRERLTQQWIAQGFIVSSENREGLEDVANLYFDVLVSRSFFNNLKREDLFGETRFEVHDLVCRLVDSVSKAEYWKDLDSRLENIPIGARHVSVSDKSTEFPVSLVVGLENLRTMRWGNLGSTAKLNLNLLSNSLRVLDLSGSVFKVLPSSISELRHLRYLDLSRNPFLENLPHSLCKLYNLETLRTDGCSIQELPKDIWKLKALRNLYVCTDQSSISEVGISALTSLRILQLCPVHNLTTFPKGLEKLTALETLVLKFCPSLIFSEDDMEGLTNLRNLTIAHLRKPSIVPSGLKCANGLTSLCFFHCLGLMSLPEWIENFQYLQRLRVEICPNLTTLPEGIRFLRRLQYLCVLGCPELSRRCGRESGEDWHKIAHVKEIHLDGKKIQHLGGLKICDFPSTSSENKVSSHANMEVGGEDFGSSSLLSKIPSIHGGDMPMASISAVSDFPSSISGENSKPGSGSKNAVSSSSSKFSSGSFPQTPLTEVEILQSPYIKRFTYQKL